jgi:TP901 family phage tail tape measure protein
VADFNVTLVFRGREDASVKRTMSRMKSEAAGLQRSLGASSDSSGGAFGAWGGGRQTSKARGALFSRQDARAWAKKGQFAPKPPRGGGGDSFFQAGNLAGGAAGMQQLTGMAQAAIGTPISLAMDFEKSLKMVNALSGGALAANGRIKDIENTSRSMSKATEFSAKQVADGFGILTQAGLPVEDQLKEIKHVLDFATAGEQDMASAAQFLVDAIGGFNMEFSDMERVGNAMARAAMSSQINLKDMGEAFKYAAPSANDLTISIEKTSAALAILGKGGVKGSMAGTGLRSFINRNANPRTNQQKAILKHLGIGKDELRKALDSGKLEDVLKLWADGFAKKGIKGSRRTAILQSFFQERGGLTANLLIKSIEAPKGAANSWAHFEEEVNDATKGLGSMAKMAREGVHGDVNKLTKSLEDFGITVGQQLTPVLTPLLEDATEMVAKFKEWAEANPTLVQRLGKLLIITVAIGTVLTPLLLILSAFKSIIGLVGLAARGTSILLGAKGLAGAITGSSTAAAAAGKAGWASIIGVWAQGILVAGALGYAAGTALDQWLGISDAIAGVNQNKFGARGSTTLGMLTPEEQEELKTATAARDEADEALGSWYTGMHGSFLSDPYQEDRDQAQAKIESITKKGQARQAMLDAAKNASAPKAGAPVVGAPTSVGTDPETEAALTRALEAANFQGGTITLKLPKGMEGKVTEQGTFPIEVESGISPEGF